ncbi:glycoprotein [Rhodococcus sp. IEGM 1370]|uniref:glycoprotein n=1 Tax=unclassified Rhodococcus (in: high G+C Gram-positive bacteria) TaxID=192944 RepID=UPI00165E86F4|nr:MULTISPECIES: glycoprotein [unclassified Rhodococcus (in: high G+C Gram-positive bacteria)]MDV8077201.1 glycoprotein [Rhodococcus sp. IEGM 1370]
MIVRARKVAAAALTTFVLAVAPSVGSAALVPTQLPNAAAQPDSSVGDASGTTSAVPDTPMTQDGNPFLTLSIETVAPSTVTTSSDPFVTVRATVTNTGDRRVDDVSVRMQAAAAVDTTAGLRTSLTLDQDRFERVGDFVTVADSLEKDESRQFDMSMQLRSTTEPSLGIEAPGVYPLLLNVNGTPEYGGTARLDDARFLLPVVGLPRNPGEMDPTAPGAMPLPPNTRNPVAMTVLWPLADIPRLAAGIPGSVDERVRLIDDELAGELATGGRLDTLLKAVEFATQPGLDPDGRLASSLCIGLDPDLLVTVSNMTRGYLVVDNPADPASTTREGTGSAAAGQWLSRLETVASSTCVTAMPFAQTDLGAVADIGDPTLLSSAVSAPADIVDGILGITSTRGFTWSTTGGVDADTADALRTAGTGTVLVADNSISPPTSAPTSLLVSSETQPSDTQQTETLAATHYDAAAAAALAGVGDTPSTPALTPAEQRFDLATDSRTARLQDALGAVNFHALVGTDRPGRTVTVAPPQYWTAGGDEPSAILSTVSSLLRSGLATPRPLAELLAEPTSGPPVTGIDAATELDTGTIGLVQSQSARVDTLMQSLVEDPQSALTPRLYTAPLREDMLRALSTAGRASAASDETGVMARDRLAAIRIGLDTIYGSVTVLAPGGVYTLASEQSPLLLVARNDLPVPVNVLLRVDAPPEMTISDVGVTQLPARGSRTITVPAEVDDTRNLSVDFSVTTLDGSRLGEVSTVSVRSNAYGQALAIITACAGALLLLLAGRRLWHRFRGQPDPADEGYERP